MLKISMS